MTTIIQENRLKCKLCGIDSKDFFCCKGCEAIYGILESQNQLQDKTAHPLYLQAVKYGVVQNHTAAKEQGFESKERIAFEIKGMWCTSCAALIELLALDLKGVTSAKVDYMTDLAVFAYDPMEISKEAIKERIEAFGYLCFNFDDPERKKVQRSFFLRLSIAFFSALNVMMFAYPLYSTFFDFDSEGLAPTLSWISLLLTLPVVTYCAFPIYQKFYLSLKKQLVGMETLVVLGIASSMLLSLWSMYQGGHQVYFDTVTMLIALLLLGKWVEQRSKLAAKESWFELQSSIPKKARIKVPELGFKIIPLKDMKEGELTVIFQGERIPLDGIVEAGSGEIDESLLTGESRPILKKRGDTAVAGSILVTGTLEIKCTTTLEKCALKQMVLSLEEEVVKKNRENLSFADKISFTFTPLLLAIGVIFVPIALYLGLSLSESLLRVLALFLIACPCAIGIAAPLAESSMVKWCAERGAIVRNRAVFSKLAKATLFAFDKTGTLTEGALRIHSGLDRLNKEELSILNTLSAYSLHPISQAIQREVNGVLVELADWKEYPGSGLEGIVKGTRYTLGSYGWMKSRNVENLEESSRGTSVFFEKEGTVLTSLHFHDQLRQGINTLPKRSILLSGDRREAVEAFAKELPLLYWKAELKPQEKADCIQRLQEQGEVVVFVGDGINDAKALAAADVGISLVSAADIAFQVSDLYLLSGKLDQVERLQKMAKRGIAIIQQNFFWAFFYNMLCIPLALCGYLTPLFATFAMTASSLFVIFNSKRI